MADPLAEALAGAAVLDKIRRRALVRVGAPLALASRLRVRGCTHAPPSLCPPQAAPAGSERHFKVGSMAIRTRWFDDQIEAALGMPVAGERWARVCGEARRCRCGMS